jgi:hypothetical protein
VLTGKESHIHLVGDEAADAMHLKQEEPIYGAPE